jgi:hypothetical protein
MFSGGGEDHVDAVVAGVAGELDFEVVFGGRVVGEFEAAGGGIGGAVDSWFGVHPS